MFGSDLLEIQQEARNNENKAKREIEEENRKQANEEAIKYLNIIKSKLTSRAKCGEISLIFFGEALPQDYYEILKRLCWEEGIIICREEGERISAKVEKISMYDNYEDMIPKKTPLDEEQIRYLRSEYAYALRIKNGEDVLTIQKEIVNVAEPFRKLKILALANALYKNGLEGNAMELEGELFNVVAYRIQSTLKHVLGFYCTDEMEAHTEILHNIYKEKAKKRGQK